MLKIHGATRCGNKFRPSDWAERIACHFSDFENGRLKYSNKVYPTSCDGKVFLHVCRSLRTENPEGWNYILKFAEENKLIMDGH